MKHLVPVDWPKIFQPKGRNGQGGALSRHELDLEGLKAMDVHYSSHVPLHQAEFGEGPPQYDRVQFLHLPLSLQGYAVTNTGRAPSRAIHTVANEI